MIDITLKNKSGQELVTMIKNQIDEHKILTWQYDEDGDFTTVQNQWKFEAWMRPVYDLKDSKHLRFGIVKRSKIILSKEVYAIYHGRFVEMILAHFDTDISHLNVSSLLVRDVDVF